MSQKGDSENDIWDYKPLKKKKKEESPLVRKAVSRRGCTLRRRRRTTTKEHSSSSVQSPTDKIISKTSALTNEEGSSLDPLDTPLKSSTCETFQIENNNGEGPSSGDCCPVCQMPFSLLGVQSERLHVADCLDFSRDSFKECPDGLMCTSTISNHYRYYNHTLLAQSRADGVVLSLPQQASPGETNHSGPVKNEVAEVDHLALKTSQDTVPRLTLLSHNSSSPINNYNNSPKITNGLLLLRSPAPEDFKKKKGWSSPKVNKSVSSCQKRKTEISSTPDKTGSRGQACNSFLKSTPSPPEIDDAISYSPLSELPADSEVSQTGPRKTLFNIDAGGSENEDSVVPFSESEDDLLVELLDNFESSNEPMKGPIVTNTQVDSVTSSPQSNQDSVAANKTAARCENEEPGTSTTVVSSSKNSIDSPHSIVLERLRATILKSESSFCESNTIQLEGIQTDKPPSSQTMTPRKIQSKAAQSSNLKQTDIGVFFGLKPLKDKENKNEPQEPKPALAEAKSENSGLKTQRKGRQRKSQASTTTESSQSTVSVDNSAEGETRRAGAGWRRRRWNTNGEVEKLRRCPFYKKIPGTKLVVDAFQYGQIEGISAYFLTHFHSDHYGGLNKQWSFPIYCNKITGNLVKSKLKVPEQYVHVLPMNTEVTVEGIKVILLEANHCPGAAMLLFFLADGQIVLHTGDFRADPSMETYPELLGSRVQTVYLDTTYCSPEYTFPKQHEVINYAANRAFELVTLNPRTLVVCGSYSVGKEKVFLALADVLGSKVCLSRDKYNTMCCLESQEVRRRITTDWKAAQVHVLPMMQLSFKKLQDHLARFSANYDTLVAFKPTGWTFSQQAESVEDIQPQVSGSISIYGIPYSEHSSFLELKRFVQWLKPLKIIPTVNNGSWESRKAMERCFSEWLKESKAKL